MRIPKNTSLDLETSKIAGEIEDWSQWVRSLLLLWDEIGRPDIGQLLEHGQARSFKVACAQLHHRTWAHANALRVIEHHSDGTATIEHPALANLAEALLAVI